VPTVPPTAAASATSNAATGTTRSLRRRLELAREKAVARSCYPRSRGT
jgi:hypothetical protein